MMHVKVDPFVKTNLYGNIIKGLIFEDFGADYQTLCFAKRNAL